MALSILSILLGLAPFYCMYKVICLFAAGTAEKAAVFSWCAWALAAYVGKVVCFSLFTGISHHAAYHILEGLRLRLVERFLHAPLGEVQKHSIGEIKSILVDKIENIEPPLAHMIPEGAGHIVLPIVSIAAAAPFYIYISKVNLRFEYSRRLPPHPQRHRSEYSGSR